MEILDSPIFGMTHCVREGVAPCVFCGATTAILVIGQYSSSEVDDDCFVLCMDCGAQGSRMSEEDEAVARWNGVHE